MTYSFITTGTENVRTVRNLFVIIASELSLKSVQVAYVLSL